MNYFNNKVIILNNKIEELLNELQNKLVEATSAFHEANLSGDVLGMAEAFSKMSEIEDSIKHAKNIQNMQNGVSHLTKFGTIVGTNEQADLFNKVYDEMKNQEKFSR